MEKTQMTRLYINNIEVKSYTLSLFIMPLFIAIMCNIYICF